MFAEPVEGVAVLQDATAMSIDVLPFVVRPYLAAANAVTRELCGQKGWGECQQECDKDLSNHIHKIKRKVFARVILRCF